MPGLVFQADFFGGFSSGEDEFGSASIFANRSLAAEGKSRKVGALDNEASSSDVGSQISRWIPLFDNHSLIPLIGARRNSGAKLRSARTFAHSATRLINCKITKFLLLLLDLASARARLFNLRAAMAYHWEPAAVFTGLVISHSPA